MKTAKNPTGKRKPTRVEERYQKSVDKLEKVRSEYRLLRTKLIAAVPSSTGADVVSSANMKAVKKAFARWEAALKEMRRCWHYNGKHFARLCGETDRRSPDSVAD